MKKRYVSRVAVKIEGTNACFWGVYDKQNDEWVGKTDLTRAEAIAEANRLNEPAVIAVDTETVVPTTEDYENRAVAWVAEQVDILKLVADIRQALADAKNYDNRNDERNMWEAYVCDIASGSWGQYQDEKVAEFFGIKFDPNDKEWLWDEIDRFESYVADVLTRPIRRHGLTGQLWFGHLESDGSYGLFYSEDVPQYEAVIMDAWTDCDGIWTDFDDMLREIGDREWLKGFTVGGDKEVIEALEDIGAEWFDTYDEAVKAIKSLTIGDIAINDAVGIS